MALTYTRIEHAAGLQQAMPGAPKRAPPGLEGNKKTITKNPKIPKIKNKK